MSDKTKDATKFVPTRGRITFDAEGTEGGRYHSRKLHVPGAWSGVTIGRGYDMGSKSQKKIEHDLVSAGLDQKSAKVLCGAAGLRGNDAKKFIKDKKLESFEITQLVQKRLFDITYADEEKEARRVCQNVKSTYGECKWDELDPVVRDLVVDLKFRGDYTGATRKHVQKLINANDIEGLAAVMEDKARWSKVPLDRFRRRKELMKAAVARKAAGRSSATKTARRQPTEAAPSSP